MFLFAHLTDKWLIIDDIYGSCSFDAETGFIIKIITLLWIPDLRMPDPPPPPLLHNIFIRNLFINLSELSIFITGQNLIGCLRKYRVK